MLNFLQDHDVFTYLQSSLIPGDSTVTICKALDDYKKVHAGCFCDKVKLLIVFGIKVLYINSKQLE